MSSAMDDFCGGQPFWDVNVVWNTTNPDFTECFQKTVLSWVPCGLLWLMSPIEIYFLSRQKGGYIPWTILNLTRTFVCAVLVLFTTLHLVGNIYTHTSSVYVPPVDFFTPAVKLISYVLILVFTVLEKKKGVQSSGVQWFFWLFSMIAEGVIYRSFLMKAFDERLTVDEVEFTSRAVLFPLIAMQFVLSCLADAGPIGQKTTDFDDDFDFEHKPCPELSCSFPSWLFFSWCDGMVVRGYRTNLERKDLWSLNPSDKTKAIFPIFERHWQKEIKKSKCKMISSMRNGYQSYKRQDSYAATSEFKVKQPSILKVLFKSFGWLYLMGTFLKLISDLFLFVNPMLLDLLINFVEGDEPQWRGFLYAGLMLTVAIINLVTMGRSSHFCYLVAMRIRSALIATIYRKALRLSSSAKRDYTLGEIVNLMAVDVQRVMDSVLYFNLVWTAPVQFSIALYLLWLRLGPAVLAGTTVLVLVNLIIFGVMGYARRLQMQQMKLKDHRIKIMNEVLNGIKVLKLYAWEKCFKDLINGIRFEEVNVLRKAAYFNTSLNFSFMSSSVLVTLISFTTYVLMDVRNILDANVAFVSISLFSVMQTPIMLMPMVIITMIQASVALNRIGKFMASDEIDPDNVQPSNDNNYPIKIENATFSWSFDESPTLTDISLRVKRNSLVAVVGTVGAGKSSLLSAILGEMGKLQGQIYVSESVAYLPQQAWMQNTSLRNNILFGKPFKSTFYETVIEACALNPDLQILPAGDQTEIGEKGINLSGGQKQRVSLARAVYHQADVYLLDDPLSAVDVHVGTHIFEKVVGPKGILKDKTRILVTHRIGFLPQVDCIVVMNGGCISEVGTYRELLERKGVFAEFLMTYLTSEENTEDNEEGVDEIKEDIKTKIGSVEPDTLLSRSLSHSEYLDGKSSSKLDIMSPERALKFQMSRKQSRKEEAIEPSKGSLIVEEATETGRVKWSTYVYYAKALTSRVVIFTVIFYVVAYSCQMGSSMWLSIWSNDKPNPDGTQNIELRNLRLGVYGALGISFALLTLLSGLVITFGTMTASEHLHSKMLNNVMHSPMTFFDTTPLGRIVNRFSKDVDVLDLTIPQVLQTWLASLFQVMSTIVVIAIAIPIFLAAAVPIGILYYFIQRFYVSTSRQLKRLESITRSPVYSHFSESVTGAATIRAFHQETSFVTQSDLKVDENQSCYYPSIISNRWIGIRLELIGNILVFCAALLAVLGRDTLNPGLVGLTVSYALSITFLLNWVVRMTSELESNIVAVERIKEYTLTPTEAEWILENSRPPPGWPTLGEIQFDRYCTRYREGLDLVLRKVTCHIKSGEKVGIVGRTGAGKSSLTLALFRIVEAAGGSILIDGIEISSLGLHDLRSRLTIIPQDPVLFSGSLRMNLDPFDQHSDEDIWKALELSDLKEFVVSLSDCLLHTVTEGGENLSVGQRQLVCLARALLRKTKILVLDEATAAVDLETDDLIQATIRKEFTTCTVLTIAHRLNTIMDNDRIIVLDQGVIKEFDTPDALLKNKSSIFYGMAKDAGLAG